MHILCMFSIPIEGITVKCNHENSKQRSKHCKYLMGSLYKDNLDLKLPGIMSSHMF